MADSDGDDQGGAMQAVPYYSGVYESTGFAPINLAGNDNISPTIDPTTPSPVSPTTPVVFTVADNVNLKGVVVLAAYPGSNTRELVWDSDHGFNGFYLGAANGVVVNRDVNGNVQSYVFTILRDGGWPANLTITAFAYDGSGNDLHPPV